ncbi:related to REI1 - cytoplasmic pre-60S factor [Melanopsichium pennsylvanicum]|uniref:Related to REI1 - cytoplasmic pre-60S factor n=2 Tax=Melanopsichium pennsylvanicum TaxID=63383 RepID=A0AAJ5C304_9BASI|nr:cytoplasmic protein [Melanopsichium pennsylvanicum 4]SNX82096.1 related to REI1 - cytoplasmic pre-60S factor [Melanopsichium pennsylvanicum]
MATLAGSTNVGEPSTAQYDPGHDDDTPLFTCLSCSIAFPNPEDQRTHYRSDLHRYNMKRRVANLPPVRADVFNAKILERRAALAQEAQSVAVHELKCEACDKKFASQNAMGAHLNSKKHKENVARLDKKKASQAGPSSVPADANEDGEQVPLVFRVPKPTSTSSTANDVAKPTSELSPSIVAAEKKQNAKDALLISEDATEEQIQQAIDAKVASSRRIDPNHECIFCAKTGFIALSDTLAHMSKVHGFFIPDREYLMDLPGLVGYLADKVAIGNICLYCNGRGKGFHNAESVRNHMLDKFHCKIAYSDQEDQLELGDFYDFTSSYPQDEDEDWEDAEDAEDEDDEDMEVDGEGRVLDLTTRSKKSSRDVDTEDRDDQIRYGDSELELVLPSGARLGHRSLRRYYQQSLRETPLNASTNDDDLSRRYGGGGALARRLIAESGMGHHDGDGTLVTGRHGQVIKARNRGEAREAKRHISEFRDRNRREQYMTRIGFRNNNQKHFRDPLLQ